VWRAWLRVWRGLKFGRGLLLNNGVVRMASRARCARCGLDLERVKNCGGFYKSVAVWLAVRAHAGFIKAWQSLVFDAG